MILVDAHAVLWPAEIPEKLSFKAFEAIRTERQHDGLAISTQSLWELAWLIDRRRFEVSTSVLDFLQTVEQNFAVLPVTSAIADRTLRLSAAYPRDPSDRLIGATALIHGLHLVTKDEKIRNSGEVNCIW